MATFDPKTVQEGSSLTEGDVTTNLANAQDAINSLDPDAIKRDVLDTQHLPAVTTGSFAVDWAPSTNRPAIADGRHRYKILDTGKGVYPGFDSGVAAASDWFVIGGPEAYPSGLQPPTTEVEFSALEAFDFTSSLGGYIGGVLLQFDCMMLSCEAQWPQARPVFALQVKLAILGAAVEWYTLSRTIRYLAHNPQDEVALDQGVGNLGGVFYPTNSDEHLRTARQPALNVSIATLVRATTLSADLGVAEGAVIRGFRAVVAIKDGDHWIPEGHRADRVCLDRFTFSGTILRSGAD